MLCLFVGFAHLATGKVGVVKCYCKFGNNIIWVAMVGAPFVDIVHLLAAEQLYIADGGENGTTDQQYGGSAFQYLDGLDVLDGSINMVVCQFQCNVRRYEQNDISYACPDTRQLGYGG